MLSLRAGLLRHLSPSSPRMNTWTPCATAAAAAAAAASQMVVGTPLRTLVLWISGMVALHEDPQHAVALLVAGVTLLK